MEDDEIEIEAKVCEESRVPKRMQNPMLPSKAEREMHELTHVPFRSWCEHCVRGRGEGVRHEAGKEMPEQTEVHMDFFFIGDEDQNEKLTAGGARKNDEDDNVDGCTEQRDSDSSWQGGCRPS